MLIRTIGLFWKREDVYWQSAARNGRILGVPKGNRRSEPINFASQIGIYVLYADYDLVYVGQTGSEKYGLYKRLKAHALRDDLSDRWNRFSWFGIRRVNNNGSLSNISEKVRPTYKEAIEHIEAVLIHSAEPPLNRQSGRFGSSVTRYFQVRDKERIGKSTDEIIRDIDSELSK